MQKDFDAWNELKKRIDNKEHDLSRLPKEGEVWMSSLGINVGFEQNGVGDSFSRPILIIKKFNNQMFWSVPLSTRQKNLDFYFNYTDPHHQLVSAILAQMKLISVKRLTRKVYDIEPVIFSLIRQKLRSFL